MDVLAITFAKNLADIATETLTAIDTQNYGNYEILVHTQAAQMLDIDAQKNKSLNAALHRNVIKRAVLHTVANWFLWVDSDVVIPRNAISDLMETGKPLVGGWYKKIRNDDWVAARRLSTGALSYFKAPEQGLVKVDMLGLGCCLIHRSVMELLEWRGGTDEYCLDENGAMYYAGNCIAYCNDAKKMGIDSYMLGSVVCEHRKRS